MTTRYLIVTVSTLERWKRKLARQECKAVWVEIEQFRANNGEPIEILWQDIKWNWTLKGDREAEP